MLSSLCDHDGLSPRKGEMVGLRSIGLRPRVSLSIANSMSIWLTGSTPTLKPVQMRRRGWHSEQVLPPGTAMMWQFHTMNGSFGIMQGKCTGIRGVLSRDTIRDSSEAPMCSALL